MLQTFGLGNLIAGFLASTISAALAVKWLVSYLQKHGMEMFGWYRIAVALIAAALVGFGILHEQHPETLPESSETSSAKGND
jgi:undecaprenyl-diphosphatase